MRYRNTVASKVIPTPSYLHIERRDRVMNYRERLTPVKAFSLGAIHGLIAGLALEHARITFENYQISQAV